MNEHPLKYEGVVVPMATPCDAKGNIDVDSASRLLNFLMDHEAVPFVMGTNGEASSISTDNRLIMAQTLVKNRRNGVPLIAGVIGLPFADTVEHSNQYIAMGIDAVVLTLPNYFQLNDRQIYRYFKSASEQINGNIILYNIPKTIHMSVPLDVIDELSNESNIIGIKDSEFDEERLNNALSKWRDRSDFFHLTGVNKLMIKGLMNGSQGIVPSTGNFAPGLYREIYEKCLEGEESEANELLSRSQELCDIYQKDKLLGESVSALKVVLNQMDLCGKDVIEPLNILPDNEIEEIVENFKKTMYHES
mgnify:CR=1 FL=1